MLRRRLLVLLRPAEIRVRRASSGGGAASKGELYEQLTPTEHVLRRPAMYVGSMSAQPEPLWLLEDSGLMVYREAHYVPGLYKIFDEILVNALDNRQRDPYGTDRISVEIDSRTGRTSVTNTGLGMPVRVHESSGVHVPELIMGNLYTGSNFDDSELRTTGGRHGFGAKLTNLFSTAFEVETADVGAGLLYKQRWRENMSVRDAPEITPLTNGAIDYTTVRFTPDLPRFELDALPADMLSIFRRRVFEAAATVAPATVEFNGEAVSLASLADLARLYAGRELEDVEFASFSNARWKVGACISPTGAFHAVSFVNGVATHHGGNHVSHVATPLLIELRAALAKKLKMNEEQQARCVAAAGL